MKKILSVILAALTLCFTVAAFSSCGNKGNVYDGLTVLETDVFSQENYGVAFRKGSDLAVRLDEMFAELYGNGMATNIAKTYGLEGSIVSTFENGTSKATSTSDYDYIKGKGTLVVGVTVFDGMDYQDANGKWIGYDADMANKFAEKLGVTAVFVEIDWDNKLIDLAAKNIDCIWNGMTVTDAILNACEVSGTYMVNGQVLVIKEGAFDSADKLAGKQIAVEGGSAGYSQATENFKTSTIKEVGSQVDALLEVSAGTSDACIIDYVLAKSLLKNVD